MTDLAAMAIIDSIEHLQENISSIFLSKWADWLQFLE